MVASWKSSSLAKLLVERHGYQRTSSRASGGRPRRQRQKASGVICSHSTRSAVTDPIKGSVPTCQRALPRQPARQRIVKVCRQPARRRIVKISTSVCRHSPQCQMYQPLPLRRSHCRHFHRRHYRYRHVLITCTCQRRGRRRRGMRRRGQPKGHAVESANGGCAKKASARCRTRLRVARWPGGASPIHHPMMMMICQVLCVHILGTLQATCTNAGATMVQSSCGAGHTGHRCQQSRRPSM